MSDPLSRLNAALTGRYHIERELGQGGMATVYLADDLRHERKVALKVLKPELAAVVGAERFLAEIKTTANLQHPHILPLFDSGEADGFLFYVMPYVEGESLRDRLDREQQLPVPEAVRIATSVAAALGYAHRRGVIHRDIKPANILLPDGQPVVADFGIALAVRSGGGDRLTETGLSVGTPHYMSPEQATGDQTVGAASDVYALGCVLYEMLVGEPPYTGSNAQAILGKIIQGQATRVSEARKNTPPNVVAAVARSLEKLAADRFATAEELARALEDPGFRWGEAVGAGETSRAGFWKPLAIALGVVAVTSVAGLGWALSRPEPPRAVSRFPSPFLSGEEPVSFAPGSFTLSRDGALVVYQGRPGSTGEQLYVRRWEDLSAELVPGSSGGAAAPSVSPGGGEVVFMRGPSLVIASLETRAERTLAQGAAPRWDEDGFVYFTSTSRRELMRVPASGGAVETVLEQEGEFGTVVFGGTLPGGGAFLYGWQRPPSAAELRVFDRSTGESTVLTTEIDYVAYVDPYLLILRGGDLLAAPFDAGTRALTGPWVMLLEGVSAFSASEDGTLLYVTGAVSGRPPNTEFAWVTRTGDVEPVEAGWTFDRGSANYGWSLSPDGSHIALRRWVDGNDDIWIKDLPDGPLRRITVDERADWVPMWAGGNERIVYLSGTPGDLSLWQVNADGTGTPELLVDPPVGVAQGTVSSDGTWIVLRVGAVQEASGERDLVTFRPGVDSTLVPLVATPSFAEQGPALSPDGRWLAYTSDETGRAEVFVRPFPDVDSGKSQISTGGGISPLWAHGRSEIYYVDASRDVIALSYQTEPAFRVTDRSVLFSLPEGALVAAANNSISLSPDDQRFLIGMDYVAPSEQTPTFVLVENFLEELRRRVPVN